VLEKATSVEVLQAFRAIGQLCDLAQYTDDQVWAAIQKQRGESEAEEEPGDLKWPEWEVLSSANPSLNSMNLRLRAVAPPKGFEQYFTRAVLAERLREVQALTGFARIDSPGDTGEAADVPKDRVAPLSRSDPV
jgi:hypothetical protein